jgi:hypothetical protein
VDLLGVDAQGEHAPERGELSVDGGAGGPFTLTLGDVGPHVRRRHLVGAPGAEVGKQVAQAVLEPLERAAAVGAVVVEEVLGQPRRR